MSQLKEGDRVIMRSNGGRSVGIVTAIQARKMLVRRQGETLAFTLSGHLWGSASRGSSRIHTICCDTKAATEEEIADIRHRVALQRGRRNFEEAARKALAAATVCDDAEELDRAAVTVGELFRARGATR